MAYNQFCPIAKAMDLLGERWTLMIAREVLCGGRRFNEFQRGLGQISPTILTKRLGIMVEQGLLIKKHIPGQRGYEYFPTKACEALWPVMEALGIWGLEWSRNQLTEDDYDLELLMLYLERSIRPEQLIGDNTIIRFYFKDILEYPYWWIVVEDNKVDVCIHDPGKEVDIYFNVTVKTMVDLWMGNVSYRKALAQKELELLGHKKLIKDVEAWLTPSYWADKQPANEILSPQ